LYADYNGKKLYTTVKEFVWNYINQPRNAEKVYPIFIDALKLINNSKYYYCNFLLMLLKRNNDQLLKEYYIYKNFYEYIDYKNPKLLSFLMHFNQNDCVQNLLGFISRDKKDKIYWYRKSADQNNSIAQSNLFEVSNGILNDKIRLEYLEKSAKQDNPAAFYQLGSLYIYGKCGLEQNILKGLGYHEKSRSLEYNH
jgi:TPR repeat protein